SSLSLFSARTGERARSISSSPNLALEMKLMTAPLSPTVFVVEDYAPVRSAVSRLLRAAGFAVAAFASPEKFLAQYDPRTPGCLVLDLDMPAVNGLELQRILGSKGSVMPIIFLTGHGDVPKSVQAMKRGAS